MRNVAPETIVTEALDALLADLRAALASLPRPDGLIAAETAVIAARELRAELWDQYRAVGAAQRATVARSSESDARLLAAKAAVDAAEAEVVRVQRALARQREAHGRSINSAIERQRAAAAAAIAGAAGILAEAAAAAAAVKEHILLPDILEFSPAMQGMIEAAGRSQSAQINRRDREFSAAAGAMAARAAPPQPAGPITAWTGKLSDLIGGPVENQAMMTNPGRSGRTSQHIPASIAAGTGPAPAPNGGFGLAAAPTTLFGRKRRT